MKRLISAAMLAVAVGGGADLATAQSAPVQPASTASATPSQSQSSKSSCFDSLWDYLKSSVKDCPLSYGPFTLYGNIDLGYGYEEWGAPVGPSFLKPNYFISHNSRNVHWLWSPNAASTTVVGIKFAQKIGGEWELIGQAEAGFNPYSLMLMAPARWPIITY